MEYLFILGRNVELSVNEVLAYLESHQKKVLSYEVVSNALMIDIEGKVEFDVNDFGGIISIGEVLAKNDVEVELEKKEIYLGTSNKFNYSIWDFTCGGFVEEVREYLKKRFRKEKLKSTEKKLSNFITLQSGKKVPNISSATLNEEYFVFEGKSKYFGRVVQKCNYEEIEKRDMEKPIRRHELSISPRLAKIMINLSGAKKGEWIVDPFCGVGVVLQEALLRGIKVVGIDKDPSAIKGAKENMDWFSFPKNSYEINNFDSTKFKIRNVDSLASEPDLGKILKKMPTSSSAKKTLRNFEELMNGVILNMGKKINKNIVFTSPFIRTIKGRVGVHIENITQGTAYKIKTGFPIPDFRHNQIVGREIVVLEKA